MADTYGFGGSEPSRNVEDKDGPGVNTKSGEAADYNLTEHFEGKAPDAAVVTSTVPGTPAPHDWEHAITGDRVSYVGNTASIGRGGQDSTLGTWPISGDQVYAGGTKTLGDEFPQDVGAQDNMNKV